MNPIVGASLTVSSAAYASAVPLSVVLPLPLVAVTVLAWIAVAVLLASVAGILGAGERRRHEQPAAAPVSRRRGAPIVCAACAR